MNSASSTSISRFFNFFPIILPANFTGSEIPAEPLASSGVVSLSQRRNEKVECGELDLLLLLPTAGVANATVTVVTSMLEQAKSILPKAILLLLLFAFSFLVAAAVVDVNSYSYMLIRS